MEEILASIRRIISEDGEGREAAPAPAPAAAPAAPPPAQAPAAKAAPPEPAAPPRPALVADAEDDEDVLVLTEEAPDEDAPPAPPPRVEESPLALEMDEPPPEPEPLPAEPSPLPSPPPRVDDRLISEQAAAASLAAMSELVTRSYREPNIESLPMGNANQTLEDLTRELLRPILKSWLDDNLPQIVERIVREEIGRLAIDAQRR
ncbi:MAG TPA: DUF2497 domain-containing protein [Stellaceae bacterium]|nr:DUF2497 domain-containing protein [Stellaceae bacterium]